MVDIRQTKVQLLHDHVYTIPGSNTLISLKSGDKFVLVKKISANWWAVLRSADDTEILFVPSSYVEEIPAAKISEGVGGIGGRKDHPPKPPVKPKAAFGKREPPSEVNKSPPKITDEARIELFNILTSNPNNLLRMDKAYPTGEDRISENNGNAENHGSNFARHKGSMQSLDLEFLDDGEYHDKETGSTDGLLSASAESSQSRGRWYSGNPPKPPDGAVSVKTFEGGYEMYTDDETGRTFYYNRQTGESTWTLPRKVSQSSKENPTDEDNKTGLDAKVHLPWTEELNEKGEAICVNQVTGERWVHLRDEQGRDYYFNDETQESRWELPEFETDHHHKFEEGTGGEVYEFSDKSGVLYKAKLSENGKKIKKSWSASYLMLCGSMLYFYKEQKTSNNVKPNLTKPEAFIDLRTATINPGGNVRSSRKNLIQLITTNGTEYLLHHDESDVIEEWYEALSKNVLLLTKLMSTLKTNDSSQSLSAEVDRSPSAAESPNTQKRQKEKTKTLKKGEVIQLQETAQSSADKAKLKEKLRFWMKSRPTRDSLRAKGIYQESIFGSHLLTICDKEKSTVPKFVQDCITAIEARGLTVDGIYRLSGNMSEIQKLRYTVNQNVDYNLMDPDLDIHVVTGALKLFFRELLEPVFPFRFFQKFIVAFGIGEPSAKSQAIKELLILMQTVNYETIKELFRHLLLVIKHSRENRMQAQNIAIVFGPTLMWPEELDASSSLAVSLVQRGQFIEYILQEYNFMFDA